MTVPSPEEEAVLTEVAIRAYQIFLGSHDASIRAAVLAVARKWSEMQAEKVAPKAKALGEVCRDGYDSRLPGTVPYDRTADAWDAAAAAVLAHAAKPKVTGGQIWAETRGEAWAQLPAILKESRENSAIAFLTRAREEGLI